MIAFSFLTVEDYTAFVLFLIPYLVIGYDILIKAGKGIKNHQVFDENFLMAVATVGAIALGDYREGVAVMLFYQIGELFQSYAVGKSRRNISDLMDIRPDYANIERDGEIEEVDPDEVEIGSIIVVKPGEKVPIDGVIIEGTTTLNTSALTGESVPRDASEGDEVISGCINMTGVLRIKTTKEFGESTVSKILDMVENASSRKSRSENFISKFAKYYTPAVCYGALALAVLPPIVRMLFMGFSPEWGDWIMRALTFLVISCPCALVLSVPLAFFSGIGSGSKKGILFKGGVAIEALKNIKAVVMDKTGTITKNQMTVQEIWVADGTEQVLVETMGLGCETDAYDPMEKAMLRCCEAHGISRESLFSNEFVRKYPFTNERKMMGHVWRKGGRLVVAAKGSPERILTLCSLTDKARCAAEEQMQALSSQGLRVIAIAAAHPENEAAIPAAITDCRLTLLGLVGLADPPRESVKNDIAVCNRAGIRVVMITGDNGITASAIAQKIGVPGSDNIITGEALEAMSDEELRGAVKTASIFSRVIPAHKMRIVKAFQENGAIVAMTGDGVNDAPALKYADIGIAMGKRGSEVSREAADLILLDDNFTTIVETVRDGRRIYDNIRKAVGYVFTIHIPIAAASLLAPFLGIAPAALLLLPLHVVLLEVLIDPTCSIVLERQPAEEDIMARTPRDPKEKLLTGKLLAKSVLQGFFIFAASFGAYFASLAGNPDNAPAARAMGLAIIMLANLFLVQVNSSDHDFAYRSVRRLSKDPVMWAVNLGTLTLLAVILYTPVSLYLKLAPLTGAQLFTAIGLAAASVLWYEFVKLVTKLRKR